MCYPLKVQNLEDGLSCIFQAVGNILKLKKSNRIQRLAYYKRSGTNAELGLFFPIKIGKGLKALGTQRSMLFVPPEEG